MNAAPEDVTNVDALSEGDGQVNIVGTSKIDKKYLRVEAN